MAITNIYKGALERSDIDKIYKGTTLLYEKAEEANGFDVTVTFYRGFYNSDYSGGTVDVLHYKINEETTYTEIIQGYHGDTRTIPNVTRITFYATNNKSSYGSPQIYITGDYTISGDYHILNGPITITLEGTTCFIEGTQISLANRTTKNVEDITYDDNLLVWNFDNATYTSAKPLWIQKQKQSLEYNHLVFSDGSELNTVNQHRIFNVEKGMFTYTMTDDTPIGTTTFNDKGEYITLVSKEIINEEVEYYNIITDYHMNLFTGTILTSCRLSNLYPIVDMQYVKDNRELHNPEIFNELDDKWVSGLRLIEQPLEINRDNAVKFDNSLIEYVKRLERSMKDDK